MQFIGLAAVAAAVAAAAPAFPTISAQQEYEWDLAISRSGSRYTMQIGQPTYLVGLNYTKGLPPECQNPTGAQVGITSFNDILFMGFRTAPFHFASNLTRMYVVSSIDAQTWNLEFSVELGTDVREPHFLKIQNETRLVFSFFQAGVEWDEFQPNVSYRSYYNGPGDWTAPQVWGQPHEIPWQLATAPSGRVYAASYEGSHYDIFNRPNISVFFNYSDDGITWHPTNTSTGMVYWGGVSEVGWAFDLNGDFWGVLRNEDGDASGWGGRIAHAAANELGNWRMTSNVSDVYIYESPRMFRHGGDLFLVARREVGAPYWNHSWDSLPWELEHDLILAEYDLAPHRTAIWHLDTTAREPRLVLVQDIPGCGDTAFPSILRIAEDVYVIVNYTSPTDQCADWSWLEGQLSPLGTAIYMITLTFTRV